MFSNSLHDALPSCFRHLCPSDLDNGANYIVQTHLPDPQIWKYAKESITSRSDTQQQINPWKALTSHPAKWGLWQRQLTKPFLLSAVKGRELGLPALSTHQYVSQSRLFVDSSFLFLFCASILTNTFGSFCSSPRLHSEALIPAQDRSDETKIQYRYRVRSRQAGLFELHLTDHLRHPVLISC